MLTFEFTALLLTVNDIPYTLKYISRTFCDHLTFNTLHVMQHILSWNDTSIFLFTFSVAHSSIQLAQMNKFSRKCRCCWGVSIRSITPRRLSPRCWCIPKMARPTITCWRLSLTRTETCVSCVLLVREITVCACAFFGKRNNRVC